MADTVESLKLELTALKAEFESFKAYAMPVIDAHQPGPPMPPPPLVIPMEWPPYVYKTG